MRRLLVTAVFLCSLQPLGAQINESVEKGGTSMGFAVVPANPATAGMAGAGLASLSTPEWASFVTPASLMLFDDHYAAGVSYLSYTPGKQTGLSVGASTIISPKMSFSLGLSRLQAASYEEFDAIGNSIGYFSPSDIKLNVGIGYVLRKGLSLGFGAHYLNSRIASNSNQGAICADISCLGVFGSLNVAGGIFNVGPGIKDSKGAIYSLPTNIALAGEYDFAVGENAAIKADLDMAYFFSAGFAASVSSELAYNDLFFARAGLHLGNEIMPSYASAGLGAAFAGFSLNVAYLFASETLGGSWMAGLGYAF